MPFYREIVENSQNWSEIPVKDVFLEQIPLEETMPLGRRSTTYFKVSKRFGYVSKIDVDETRDRISESGAEPGFLAPREPMVVFHNMQTDLASVPKLMWGIIASYGRHTMPALVHDRLCDCARTSSDLGLRRLADKTFREMLKYEASIGIVTRWLMWCAVRLFASTTAGLLAIALGVTGWTALLSSVTGLDALAGTSAPTGSLSRLLWLIVGGLGLLLFAILAIKSLEARSVEFLSVKYPPGEEREEARTVRRFSLIALLSLLGASAIGATATALIAPLLLVTFITWLILTALDQLAKWIHYLVTLPVQLKAKGEPRSRITRLATDEPNPAVANIFRL